MHGGVVAREDVIDNGARLPDPHVMSVAFGAWLSRGGGSIVLLSALWLGCEGGAVVAPQTTSESTATHTGSTHQSGAGGAGSGGALQGGAGGLAAGGASVAPMPDFSLVDQNPNSATYQQAVSPHDYHGKVSAWYFGHAT